MILLLVHRMMHPTDASTAIAVRALGFLHDFFVNAQRRRVGLTFREYHGVSHNPDLGVSSVALGVSIQK